MLKTGRKLGEMKELCFIENAFCSRKERRAFAYESIRCACWLPPDNWIDSNHIQGYCLHVTSPLCLLAWYKINFSL